MALNAGKLIKTKGVDRQQPPKKPEPAVKEVNKYDHAVVVNGKQKKISKKSAFLLDMLTLDDE